MTNKTLALRMMERAVGLDIKEMHPAVPLGLVYVPTASAAIDCYMQHCKIRYEMLRLVWDWFNLGGGYSLARRPTRSVGKSTSSPAQQAVRAELQAFRNDLIAVLAPMGARVLWDDIQVPISPISWKLVTTQILPRYFNGNS